MALSKSVEESLKEAEQSLRNALAWVTSHPSEVPEVSHCVCSKIDGSLSSL